MGILNIIYPLVSIWEVRNITIYDCWAMLLSNIKNKEMYLLIKLFKSIDYLYKVTQDKEKFKSILIKNKLYISYNTYKMLVSDEIKKQALDIKKLNVDNIYITFFYDKDFPIDIRAYNDFPKFVICRKEKINFLNSRNPFILNDFSSEYSVKVFSNYITYFKSNNQFPIILNNEINNVKKGVVEIINKCCKIQAFENNIESIKNIIAILKEKKQYIFIPYFIDFKRKINLKKDEIKYINEIFFTSIFSDFLVIIQERYNRENLDILDLFLDFGKEIYAVPGDVFNEKCKLANYVIKNGANVLLEYIDNVYI